MIVVVLSIFLTSIMISSLWIYYTYTEFKSNSAMAEKIYIDGTKNLLIQKVETVKKYIEEQRKEWTDNIKYDAMDKTFMGYLTAYTIYNRYKNIMSQNKIKSYIINLFEALELCRKGYFFIYDVKKGRVYGSKAITIPVTVLYMLKKITNRELFINIKQNDLKILGYVKLFEPFDWYIGYIRLINAKENTLESKIMKHLSSYRFDHNKHGYIFVYKLLNPYGGHCFAKVLINSKRPLIAGKCLSDNVADINGQYFRKQYLEELRKHGFVTVQYSYKIPGENKIGERLSYMALYKPWNLIIGTGYCIKDLKRSFINLMMGNFENNLYKKIGVIIIISLVVLILLFSIYLFFYNVLNKDIKFIENFFKTYPKKRNISVNDIKIEDVYGIALKINDIAEKMDRYSDSLKESLEKYHRLMSHMPDCVVICRERNGKIVVDEINKCIESLLGKNRHAILGKNVDDVFVDIPALPLKVYDVFKSKIAVESFDCVKKPSGNEAERYYSCIAYSLRDDTVVSILKDITDKILLFRQIEKRQKQMEMFSNTINAGIIVSSEDNKIIYMNSMAKNILEVGDNPSKKDMLRIIDNNNILALLNRLMILNDKSKNNKCQNCSMKIKTKTGKEKWLDLSVGYVEFDNRYMFVASFYDITKRYLKEKEVEYMSFHDSLTGLYNRRYFEEELNRLFNSRNYPLVLVIYDLNGLKIVNDTLGHKAGDDLIRRFGYILMKSSRVNDVAARIGGDEFAVIMPNTDKRGVEIFIKRVEGKIKRINQEEMVVPISVSFGYAVQKGNIGSIEELFSLADSDMYENKYRNRDAALDEVLKSAQHIKHETS